MFTISTKMTSTSVLLHTLSHIWISIPWSKKHSFTCQQQDSFILHNIYFSNFGSIYCTKPVIVTRIHVVVVKNFSFFQIITLLQHLPDTNKLSTRLVRYPISCIQREVNRIGAGEGRWERDRGMGAGRRWGGQKDDGTLHEEQVGPEVRRDIRGTRG